VQACPPIAAAEPTGQGPACNPPATQSLSWYRAFAQIQPSGSVPLQGRAEVAMSSIPTITELQRWESLAAIRAAVKARLPDKFAAAIGLADIAELCKRDLKARPTRDCHDVRDQILQIAIEWDLDRDALDQQSNVCLCAIVSLLR